MEKRHRIFIAINLPEEVKRGLFLYSEKFSELPAKWTDKDNLHITLEFLGALTDEEIGEVCVIVKEVAGRHESFSLNLNKILYGPPNPPSHKASEGQGKIPKMVWAEGEKSKELDNLKKDLQEVLLEKIRFMPAPLSGAIGTLSVPHITLARISSWAFKQIEPEERPEINETIDLVFTVESIDVMESVLKPASRQGGRGGPVYEILESHNFKN